ncbi:type I-C CRISPR-associated protein Cas8c/Csd1 [Faecalicatena sp. AGMB00832]|uniref:Type I-C CRISPR-associated protein Cas8c/Csd1 n=1 Tax=Faecalicatena faecalis TaxID=2726362 RepID=A0ABS6D9E4_9FIRM|nr:type I-C CRISPR-associated protein Cas8c/Csd1 [Faecalicatena faecalis]MBU3878214.1 type I-C CRISPR-associated protein Cas8c/Csd1 [Faecalicatena faecalis]
MILQALVKHYETLAEQEKVAKQGWCQAKVSYALDIDAEGNLLGVISVKQEVQRGKKTAWVPQMIEVPEMVSRSSGIAANFLCDNSKYILGIDKDGTGKRIMECFQAAKEKHCSLLDSAHSEAAIAVKNFFQKWDPTKAKENAEILEKWEDITAGGNLIFYVGMGYAQDEQEICDLWEKRLRSDSEVSRDVCLVTGDKTEISRIHTAIKGVQGAQPSGAALVSFNAPSFESYGKEQSYNAPVGKYAMFAYTTALNYLLSQRDYVFMLGDTTIVFWAEDGEEIYQRLFIDSMEPAEDNQEILKSIFSNLQAGRSIDIEGIQINPEQKFYILGLAPNAARLSVRFFYQNSFGKILSNLQVHYDEMKIVRPSWDGQEFLGVWRMLMETLNQKSKDKKPQSNMAASVFEAILSGKRYPESLYSNVMIRIRAEQGRITRGRAAIIRACLIRNHEKQWIKEGEFVGLNEQCKDVAYVLGREFAVLEAIQEDANPGINATIKDRYFNSACATPASVFPILQKLKNSHIRKLETGKKIYYEKMLTELQGKIEVGNGESSALPRRLSLEEQGMFILGYYHQVQKRYEKKEEK